MTKAKLFGVTAIVGGAALTGAMLGWELGMCKLEMSRDQIAMAGAGCGAILAVVGCALAIERSEARAQSRALMLRFERILFRTKQLAGVDAPDVVTAMRESGSESHSIPVAGSHRG